MLDSKGFDLWSDNYDKTVALSEEAHEYPFAGYKTVLNEIYKAIRSADGKTVLDVGFGTAILTHKLYTDGCTVYGIDFSEKMLQAARSKMPNATLIQHDFSTGLPPDLQTKSFDFIICTYALHHLTNPQKIAFIKELLPRLVPKGKILIGDIACETRSELEDCKTKAGNQWDDEEIYSVAEQLKPALPTLQFRKISFCAGIFTLENR